MRKDEERIKRGREKKREKERDIWREKVARNERRESVLTEAK